jgi:hypothetical protein
MSGVVAVAANGYQTRILKTDGSLQVTGTNLSGQLRDGATLNRLSFFPLLP